MTNEIGSRHAGLIAIAAGVIAAPIYLAMIGVTLAHIETVSGQRPFDMRPLGYGPTEAAALLDALGPEGRAYYLSHQIPLDTLYPAMMALTLIAAMRWLGRHTPGRTLVNLGTVVSVGAALCDYAENLGIVVMIQSWPNLSDPLVQSASTATIAKSVLTTLAMSLALLMAGLRVFRAIADARLRRTTGGSKATSAPG